MAVCVERSLLSAQLAEMNVPVGSFPAFFLMASIAAFSENTT